MFAPIPTPITSTLYTEVIFTYENLSCIFVILCPRVIVIKGKADQKGHSASRAESAMKLKVPAEVQLSLPLFTVYLDLFLSAGPNSEPLTELVLSEYMFECMNEWMNG